MKPITITFYPDGKVTCNAQAVISALPEGADAPEYATVAIAAHLVIKNEREKLIAFVNNGIEHMNILQACAGEEPT